MSFVLLAIIFSTYHFGGACVFIHGVRVHWPHSLIRTQARSTGQYGANSHLACPCRSTLTLLAVPILDNVLCHAQLHALPDGPGVAPLFMRCGPVCLSAPAPRTLIIVLGKGFADVGEYW